MLSADISHRKRTATMTFRIDEHILNLLKKESERRDISLNILVNHVLKQYVEWDNVCVQGRHGSCGKACCFCII